MCIRDSSRDVRQLVLQLSAHYRRGHRHRFVRGRFDSGDLDLHPALWCNAVYREVFLCELGLCLDVYKRQLFTLLVLLTLLLSVLIS